MCIIQQHSGNNVLLDYSHVTDMKGCQIRLSKLLHIGLFSTPEQAVCQAEMCLAGVTC